MRVELMRDGEPGGTMPSLMKGFPLTRCARIGLSQSSSVLRARVGNFKQTLDNCKRTIGRGDFTVTHGNFTVTPLRRPSIRP
jgi:hypothetical protein